MTPYLTSLATIYNYLYGTTICGDAFLHLIGWKWVKRIFLHILSPATIYVFWWQYVLHDLTYIIVGDNLCRTTIYAVTAAPRQRALSNYALIFNRNVGHMPFMQHCNRNRSLVNCAKFGADVSVRELIMERWTWAYYFWGYAKTKNSYSKCYGNLIE